MGVNCCCLCLAMSMPPAHPEEHLHNGFPHLFFQMEMREHSGPPYWSGPEVFRTSEVKAPWVLLNHWVLNSTCPVCPLRASSEACSAQSGGGSSVGLNVTCLCWSPVHFHTLGYFFPFSPLFSHPHHISWDHHLHEPQPLNTLSWDLL